MEGYKNIRYLNGYIAMVFVQSTEMSTKCTHNMVSTKHIYAKDSLNTVSIWYHIYVIT